MKIDPIMRLAAVAGGAALLATWFGVRPLHVRAASIEHEALTLHIRASEETVPAARLDAFRREAIRRAEMLEQEQVLDLPVGPPDLAGVIRRLSLPIDGIRVIDQTFTAGRSTSAGLGSPEWWRSSPVQVELVADWASIRRLLGLIDALSTPVRTTTIEIERLDSKPGIARLRLELDALHLADDASGGRPVTDFDQNFLQGTRR